MYQCKSIYVPVKRISIDQQLLTRMPLIYLYLYEICHVNSLVPSIQSFVSFQWQGENLKLIIETLPHKQQYIQMHFGVNKRWRVYFHSLAVSSCKAQFQFSSSIADVRSKLEYFFLFLEPIFVFYISKLIIHILKVDISC